MEDEALLDGFIAPGYQDTQFVVEEVIGKEVAELLGAVDTEEGDDLPVLIYLRLKDQAEWHRFFLDAGIAFWHFWDDATIQAEFESEFGEEELSRLVNYAERVGGLPQTVKRAEAGPEASTGHTQISVSFESGLQLTLTADPNDEDGNNHLTINSK